jgi:hypothetical protein
MGVQQLRQPLLVSTIFGEAICRFSDDGNADVEWGCFQKATGELWWFRGHEIRYAIHLSEGFHKQSKIYMTQDRFEAFAPHLERYGVSHDKIGIFGRT